MALDLSLSASGVAVFDGGLISVDTLRPPGLAGMERLEWIMRRVVDLTEAAEVVLIEGYAFARPNQAHQIGELGGVIRLALHTRRVPYVEVAPKQVKKLATGKGNAGKELVLVEAVKRLEYAGADNNEADALWLLQAALQHFALPGAVELPKAHLQALEKIDWPRRRAA